MQPHARQNFLPTDDVFNVLRQVAACTTLLCVTSVRVVGASEYM